MANSADTKEQHSLLDTNFPVNLPVLPELHFTKSEFEAYIRNSLGASEFEDIKPSAHSTEADGTYSDRQKVLSHI